MSWSEEDPGQGSPDLITGLSSSLGTVASSAASASAALKKLQEQASDAIWRGSSADAFRDRIDKLPGHLDKLSTSYQDASDGFSSYSASVGEIKTKAGPASTAVSNAESAVSSATTQQAGYTPPPEGGRTNPYDAAVESAKSRLSTAKSTLHQLSQDRSAADSKVKGALSNAHDDGMQNKHWWQKALDFISDALKIITIVLLVIAVIAIIVLAIVCPALIPGLLLLAGEVLTVLSAAQLAVDGTRKLTGEDVSWTDLGLDALGCLPFGKLAAIGGMGAKGAAMFAKVADKLAPALAKGGTYLTRATTALKGSLKALGFGDKIAARITTYTKQALKEFDEGKLALSRGQSRAVKFKGAHPNTFKGQVLDKRIKELTDADPYLTKRSVTATPQGKWGPDWVNPKPKAWRGEKNWYDVTTKKSWGSHPRKYDGTHPRFDPKRPDYGDGGAILWDQLIGR